MKGLLIKDFYLNFLNRRTILMYIAIIVFMAFSMNGSFIIGYSAMLMGILAISTLSYDEMDNGFPFLLSLPISRKTYVREKFLYYFLMEIGGGIVGIIIYVVTALIKKEPVGIFDDLPAAIGFILAVGVMISVMIPIQLKYGVEKSRLTMLVIYGIIFAISYLISRSESAIRLLARLVLFLQNSSPALIVALVALFCLAVLSVCYLISVRIMNNKEF